MALGLAAESSGDRGRDLLLRPRRARDAGGLRPSRRAGRHRRPARRLRRHRGVRADLAAAELGPLRRRPLRPGVGRGHARLDRGWRAAAGDAPRARRADRAHVERRGTGMTMCSNTLARRIEWGDCDPAGIVFNPAFFAFFDDATSMLIEAAGWPLAKAAAQFGILGWPLVATRAEFRAPCATR